MPLDANLKYTQGFFGGVTTAKLDQEPPSWCPHGATSNDLSILCNDSSLELSEYWDQKFSDDNDEQERLLMESSTLYVGNLSFYTTEEQIYELFSRCGDIKNVYMGLDKIKKMGCGFCFVEYFNRAEAENAMQFLNGTSLDDHIICTDWDLGFREGRQYGRGQSGGQLGDAFHEDFNVDRGGFGKQAQVPGRRGIHSKCLC
ncbi:nuclear cap-binding protein subunit 2-like [Bos javanicus]|uniref:nuclear cap-binding protein subunit 2-like n=1 Tax=Bos javanicus TaxID=9906 RepID=UPI002AA75B43|nr:nuclear cap-binding protein subunit 2-like [Bos javanicus]